MGTSEVILLFLTVCSVHLNVKSETLDDEPIEKRAPGWGKRDSAPSRLGYLESVFSDLSRYELNKDSDSTDNGIEKRRPGWGKRSFSDDFELDKRKPGWGKRSFSFDSETLEEKRAPGWGKRSFNSDFGDVDFMSKRRPGWGKRNMYDGSGQIDKRRPGWGKRAPGWGKRSSENTQCEALINEAWRLRLKLAQMREEVEMCASATLQEDLLDH